MLVVLGKKRIGKAFLGPAGMLRGTKSQGNQISGESNLPQQTTQKNANMSMQLAQMLDQTLMDILPMSELVGMKGDVEAARQLLKTIETADDLYSIYRTDVSTGSMSIRNLLAVLLERLDEIHCRSSYGIQRIKMTLASSHIESLHKTMKDKKKGDTTVNLYQPNFSASDLEKAMNEFKDSMGDSAKPKFEYAMKKGKGLRCARLHGICKPVIVNSKKNYSESQIASAKTLAKVMRHT